MAVDTSLKSKNKPTFTIFYGLASGKIHGRKLTSLLEKAGYIYTNKAAETDIIIAHSAGCWLIPANAKPKLVIYVGMPLNQSKPMRTWLDANTKGYLGGSWSSVGVHLICFYYHLRQPRHNLVIARMAKGARARVFSKSLSIFITNHNDPWPQNASQILEKRSHQKWIFIDLPGTHYDIWEHPARYVNIVNKYAKML